MSTTAQACRSCTASIYWLVNDSTQRHAPIDVEPSPMGNLRIDLAEGTYSALNRERAQIARDAGEHLHRSHFTSCPDAPRWSRQ